MFSLSIHLSFSHPALPPFSFLSNVDPVWRLQIQDLEAQVEDVRRQLQREGEATTQLRSNLQEERSRSATLQESLVELQSEKAALAVQQDGPALRVVDELEVETPESIDEREKLVIELIEAVVDDKVVSEAERKILQRVAKAFAIPEAQINGLVAIALENKG